uniref:Uncharacterized protein n=1 Tax=Anas platyrhynchos TaxID=8839 RepID=A0A8B9R695_ANAPL
SAAGCYWDTARPGLRDAAGGGRGQTPQGGVGLPQETPPVSVRLEFPFKVILNVLRLLFTLKLLRTPLEVIKEL